MTAPQCFCGDSSSRLYKHGKADNCNMDCPGRSGIEKCGGRLAISVFQYEGSPSDIPKNSDYLGCFTDKRNDRALTLDDMTSDKGMTYAVSDERSNPTTTQQVVSLRSTTFFPVFNPEGK